MEIGLKEGITYFGKVYIRLKADTEEDLRALIKAKQKEWGMNGVYSTYPAHDDKDAVYYPPHVITYIKPYSKDSF